MLINLSQSYKITGQKLQFEELYINDDSIEIIEKNFFQGIKFEKITFENCTNLKSIDEKAFAHTEMEIIIFKVIGDNQIENSNALFNVISRMINLEMLRIEDTKIIQIPDYAFHPINGIQYNLTHISFDSRCTHGAIKKLGNFPFYYLPNLVHIDLSCLSINKISKDAFVFKTDYNLTKNTKLKKLYIDLSLNRITQTTFEDEFVIRTNRPTELILNYNPIEYLDEKLLKMFLFSNNNNNHNHNSLVIWQNNSTSKLKCSSYKMEWLTGNKQIYQDKIRNTLCSDGRWLWRDSEKLHLTIAQINEPKTGSIYKVDSLHKKQLYK